ncbi:MAG TPA: polysaccharide deacetylase family protein [Paludibacter sp.]|nr:polysaccharide deacetylase family protein [Paludibacter sp.]
MIVTTSWDDGHPLDMKLLSLLEKYNMRATFYVPITNPENPVMGKKLIREISACQEVGGHTLNHLYLNHLNDTDAEYEITQCKIRLEEITGNPPTAFCFPGGKYSTRDIGLIKKAGFLFGRTTRLLTCSRPGSALMDTTVQVHNHSTITLINHCVKNSNLSSIPTNMFFLPFNKNFLKLAEALLLRNLDSNCVYHIWGHSWEIEQFNMWKPLEELFKLINTCDNIILLNNTETWKAING